MVTPGPHGLSVDRIHTCLVTGSSRVEWPDGTSEVFTPERDVTEINEAQCDRDHREIEECQYEVVCRRRRRRRKSCAGCGVRIGFSARRRRSGKKARHFLRQPDRIALRHEGDARGELQPLGEGDPEKSRAALGSLRRPALRPPGEPEYVSHAAGTREPQHLLIDGRGHDHAVLITELP